MYSITGIKQPMVQAPQLTLKDFLALPDGDVAHELVDGKAVPKLAPKRFHSKTQKAILRLLDDWAVDQGEVGLEWSVTLKRKGRDWCPVPDILFVASDRLPADYNEDGPCPVPPNVAIEIISPDQTFGAMAEKAFDYLVVGTLSVWIVDPRAKTVTVFHPEAVPVTYRGNTIIDEPQLPELNTSAQIIFDRAGLLG